MKHIIENQKKIIGNEKGFTLVVVILMIAVLVLLGSTAIMSTTTDLKISGNYKQLEQAFFNAEAGLEEARTRLRGSNTDANYAGDPATSVDPIWSAYVVSSASWSTSDDTDYDATMRNYFPTTVSHTSTTSTANSLLTSGAMDYAVKIRHKREYDAEQRGHDSAWSQHYYDGDGNTATHSTAARGNLVYYGYGDPAQPTTAVQFTTSGVTDFKPVELITAWGENGTASKIIEIEAVHSIPPPIASAVYSKGNMTGNGSSMSVNGNDNCGVAPAKPPVSTLIPATSTINGNPVLTGAATTPVQTSTNIDIQQHIIDLRESATIRLTTDINSTTPLGTATNFVTVYSDTANPYNNQGLKLSNVNGYGVLLVDGDLEMGGGFSWEGLILVNGTLTFNGGGSGINIKGAVMAVETVDINGGLDIRYDSCNVNKAFANQSLRVVNWRSVY